MVAKIHLSAKSKPLRLSFPFASLSKPKSPCAAIPHGRSDRSKWSDASNPSQWRWGDWSAVCKARCVAWQVPVQIPTSPNVTKLKRSCDAATHLRSRAISERWHCRFFSSFFLRFLFDRLSRLCTLDLGRTPEKCHKHQ